MILVRNMPCSAFCTIITPVRNCQLRCERSRVRKATENCGGPACYTRAAPNWVCAFTTDPTDAPLFRLPIEPTEDNGLRIPCRLMADKITTVQRGVPLVGAKCSALSVEVVFGFRRK